MNNKLSLFEEKETRKTWINNKLYFSIIDIVLALTNLGEATAIEFHKKNNSQGFKELKKDMNKAGVVLNKAKTEIENELERPIVTSQDYIELTQAEDLLDIK